MFLATIAALLTLAEPTGPPPATDEPKAAAEQPVTPIAPAESAIPAEGVAPPLAPIAAPPPAPPVVVTPPPSPPSAEAVEEADPPSPPSRPFIRAGDMLGLELGYARGGDRLVTLVDTTSNSGKSINAGDGVSFTLAASWTPYWSKRGVGLGVYARAGAKLASVEGGMTSLTFVRWPLAAGAQLLLPVASHWFVVGRLGVMTEVLGRLTIARGAASQNVLRYAPTLGEFLDAGPYWALTEYAGLAAFARYERLEVTYDGGPATSANNLGVVGVAILGF